MNNYIIYMHITPNNKRYIGITQQDINKRWQNGLGYKKQYFYRAIAKYGWDNIQHIIIAKGLSEEEAVWIENMLINVFNSNDKKYGYNISEGGYIISEETRKKMSENRKGKCKGENHCFYGKPRSLETKMRISEATKGKKRTIETKRKISESRKNKLREPFSEEHKQKISESNKKSSPYKKRVICTTTNEIFESISDAARTYNIAFQGISLCCKGNAYSCGVYNNKKLQWRFIDEFNSIIEPKTKTVNKKKREPLFRPVMCLTTKKMFCNFKEAQKFYNIKGNTALYDYFKYNKKSCGVYNNKKLQWKLINYKHNKKFRIKRCNYAYI